MINLDKQTLINKLTLLDVSLYRKSGLSTLNKERRYKKEPSGFRAELSKVYEKLDKEDIIILICLKEK